MLLIVADWPGHFPNGAQVVGILASAGADVRWIGYDRKTPSDVAVESGSESLIQWLRLRAIGDSAPGTLR